MEQAAQLLGKDPETIQKRFLKLTRLRFLNREKRSGFDEYIYFPARAGGVQIADRGYAPEIRFIGKKSPMSITHDWTISQFHAGLELALRNTPKPISSWQQWRRDMKDMQHLVPDGRFALEGDEEYSMLENHRHESEYENGKSSFHRKLIEYADLGVYRVYVLMKTQEKRDMFVKKIAPELNTTKLWFATVQDALVNPLGSIWRTPHNYESRSYSILPPTD